MRYSIVFPGQGSQYTGMSSAVMKKNPEAVHIFEEASDVLGLDLHGMIEKTSMKEITKSENAQPAVLTTSYALFRTFINSVEVMPKSLAGHSLGEITALVCAKSIPFAQGVAFARDRGKIMQKALDDNKGFTGVVTDLTVAQVEGLLEEAKKMGYVAITGYNSPKQLILGGERRALRVLDDAVDEAGGQFIPFRMIPMKADAPYHSELMSDIEPMVKDIVDGIRFSKPIYTIWSSVTGSIIKSETAIPQILIKQLISPIQWMQALNGISEDGVDFIVDIGPNKIMRNLAGEYENLPVSLAYDDEPDFETIKRHFQYEPQNDLKMVYTL